MAASTRSRQVMCLYSLAGKYVPDRASLRRYRATGCGTVQLPLYRSEIRARAAELIASTSSSVRWLSTSNTAGCRFHHQRNQDDKAAHSPSGRDPATRRAWRIRRAPLPGQHGDNRRCPVGFLMHLVTDADLFHHQRMAVKKTVRANALHKRIHRNNQYATLHRR